MMATASSSKIGFWETLDLISGKEAKNGNEEEALQEWLNKLTIKREMRTRKISEESVRSVTECVTGDTGANEFVWIFDAKSVKVEFSHPHVRTKLEKLMGSNVVSLTDRAYMLKLQDRILEEHAAAMAKRIKIREAQEMVRVKNLVLTGKIPLDNAPPEMADHPIMLIELYCRKLIAERRAKIKLAKVRIPTHIYWDDTPDPPSGLSIEKGHVFRKEHEKLCIPPETFLLSTDEEDVEAGYMFSEEDFERLKYESSLVKELRNCETVEEMYNLADEIIGALKTIAETIYGDDDRSSAVANVSTAGTSEKAPPQTA